MTVVNALAHYDVATIMTVKSFYSTGSSIPTPKSNIFKNSQELSFFTNLRLTCKCKTVTNALAYYMAILFKAVKKFYCTSPWMMSLQLALYSETFSISYLPVVPLLHFLRKNLCESLIG
jgi:hypothetical protein